MKLEKKEKELTGIVMGIVTRCRADIATASENNPIGSAELLREMVLARLLVEELAEEQEIKPVARDDTLVTIIGQRVQTLMDWGEMPELANIMLSTAALWGVSLTPAKVVKFFAHRVKSEKKRKKEKAA